ncbi:hypothetical protein [Olivibacter sitiensis]|uniref:hypothetical protein n=1 Tax=Olivibacter sitiensis TaxID=376470 RepID=UPI0004280189|nr:hypothetical protein [Olivibacter sitiensis]
MRKKVVFLSLLIGTFTNIVLAQSYYHPYSYQFYQKLNPVLYGKNTRQHTSIKPLLIDSVIQPSFDSLMYMGGRERTSWGGRKLWQEHLIDVKNEEYTFYADFLPDFQVGRSFKEGVTTWLNTRGFQFGGSIGTKFSFYTNFFESQARFPDYINAYIDENKVIPGQQGKLYDQRTGLNQDWSYATANLSYTASKYLNVSLAYDKNFIGDGYRSLLLSDVSSNYTALKLTGTLGNVRYMSMWAYMLDPFASRYIFSEIPDDGTERSNYGDLHKWGAFQYLDWNVSNSLSLGFFQSILWAPKNAAGKRGFDFNYLNPLIFLRPIESANTSSPDKVHLGLNVKYKILNNMTSYGQFLLGEFTAKEFFAGNGYMHNKFAYQLGIKGYELFRIPKLNYLVEFNTARPYTYQHFTPITAYTNYNQPLAHILGANFREGLAIINYSQKRFDFQLQGNWAMYGKDPDEDTNYGGNVFKDYMNYVNFYGNYIGQGVNTHLTYLDLKTAYLINPKYNLRLEMGIGSRREWNKNMDNTTVFVNFGLRASFRNLYYDF